MFTGIIEKIGKVVSLRQEGGNLHLDVESVIGHELRIDQSVSHNGVCLTVVEISGNIHTVTAIGETLRKTNIGQLKPQDLINLERCMKADGRFDGHIVQGHVDGLAEVTKVQEVNGSWEFDFSYSPEIRELTVEKGSICINGVSLTCFNCIDRSFRVAIIPYTYEHTNFQSLKKGDQVNLEFDIVGKYVRRLLDERKS